MSEKLGHKKDVEGILRSRLSDVDLDQFNPPDAIWENIESEISSDRRRYFIPIFFFSILALGVLITALLMHNRGSESEALSLSQQNVNIENQERNNLEKEVIEGQTKGIEVPVLSEKVMNGESRNTNQINSSSASVDKTKFQTLNNAVEKGQQSDDIVSRDIYILPTTADIKSSEEKLVNEKSIYTENSVQISVSELPKKEIDPFLLTNSPLIPLPFSIVEIPPQSRTVANHLSFEVGANYGIMNSSTDHEYDENGSSQRFKVLGNEAKSLDFSVYLPIAKSTELVLTGGWSEIHFEGNYNLSALGANLKGSDNTKNFITQLPSYAGRINADIVVSKVSEDFDASDVIPVDLSLNHGVEFYNIGLGISRDWLRARKFGFRSQMVGGIIIRKETIETPNGRIASTDSNYSTETFDLSLVDDGASLSLTMPYLSASGRFYYRIGKKTEIGVGLSFNQLFDATANNPDFNINLRTYSAGTFFRYRF